jgi:serine/threonine-protein kinase
MDFGIAHLTSSNMTRTGVMVGTPAYMAPEQIVGGEITPASDLFAVGAVMYELFTGKKPFQGETLQSVMYKIVSQPAPSMTKVATDVPASLGVIVERALAKEPSGRFAGALEMATALSATRSELAQSPRSSTPLSLRSSIATALADEKAAKARSAMVRRVAIGGGSIAAIAAVVIAAFTLRGDSGAPSTGFGQGSQLPSPPAAGAPLPVPQPTTPAPPVTSSAPAVSPAPAPSDAPARASAPPPKTLPPATRGAKTLTPPAPTAPTAQEVALFRSLQSTALQVRRRAGEAGATAEQLDVGDAHNRSAGELFLRGRVTEAAERLDQAAAAWNNAERLARIAAAATATRSSAPEQTKAAPTAPAATVTQAPLPTPLPPANPTTTPQAVSNPVADINTVVAAYARAIESRDIAAIRRAYPGITPAQVRGFEQFFATVQSLRATFNVSGLDVSGSTAEAQLVGAYDYVTEGGRTNQQRLTFHATFRREGGAWQIASVR